MATSLFAAEISLFSASVALRELALLSVPFGPPAANISTPEKPPACGYGRWALSVAERGKEATTRAEPLVCADTSLQAAFQAVWKTDLPVMLEQLGGMHASLVGMAFSVAALEVTQAAATVVRSALTRGHVGGLPVWPVPTLHTGGRAPPLPPLKMGGLGATLPFLEEGGVEVLAAHGSLAAALQFRCHCLATLTRLVEGPGRASLSQSSSSAALDGVHLTGPVLPL